MQGDGSEEVRLCRIVKGGGKTFLVVVFSGKTGRLDGGGGGGKLGTEKYIA